MAHEGQQRTLVSYAFSGDSILDVTLGDVEGVERVMARTTLGAGVRTDAELIVASRADSQAFRELYDHWSEPLLRYFARRVFDAEIAADLTAETFAVAYERAAGFRDLGRPGGAWLYGIAAKELSHFFRRREVELRAVNAFGRTPIIGPPAVRAGGWLVPSG